MVPMMLSLPTSMNAAFLKMRMSASKIYIPARSACRDFYLDFLRVELALEFFSVVHKAVLWRAFGVEFVCRWGLGEGGGGIGVDYGDGGLGCGVSEGGGEGEEGEEEVDGGLHLMVCC